VHPISNRGGFVIAWLSGIVHSKSEHSLILNVGGVGYEVNISPLTSGIEVSEEVALQIYTHVREDQLQLFGFKTVFEKEIFLQLIQVSGVGPKTALGILSHISAAELAEIIRTQNIHKLQTVQGIGKKTSERLLVELKDKIKFWPKTD